MALTFIRHAESLSNAGGVTRPHETIALSELGHTQAQVLATRWKEKPAAVWVSNFLRTQQTAVPFCQRFNVTAQVHPDLHEFSVIDPALIAGLDGPQRKPFVKAYWDDPDPNVRLGEAAETFAEFEDRVLRFRDQMDQLPDGAVLFGHGIWMGLLFWQLLGQRGRDGAAMREFRNFQLQLPMPNCAVFAVSRTRTNRWHVERGMRETV